jgi:site-specific DNA-methyltransferase (adenine-specific)
MTRQAPLVRRRADGGWEILELGSLAAGEPAYAPWEARMQPYYEHNGITIFHGDCRAILPGLSERPALVLTDPPYGVDLKTDYATRQRTALAQCNDFPPIAGDDTPFDPSHILALDCPSILWGANYYADKVPPSPSWLVWDKLDGLTSKRDIGFNDQADLEMAWSNLGGPARICYHRWMGAMKGSEQDKRRLHPSHKPVYLMRWCLLRAKLQPGALVLDPYMGSGPIAQACKELGYRYIGIELVEAYAEIAARRLAQEVMELTCD